MSTSLVSSMHSRCPLGKSQGKRKSRIDSSGAVVRISERFRLSRSVPRSRRSAGSRWKGRARNLNLSQLGQSAGMGRINAFPAVPDLHLMAAAGTVAGKTTGSLMGHPHGSSLLMGRPWRVAAMRCQEGNFCNKKIPHQRSPRAWSSCK